MHPPTPNLKRQFASDNYSGICPEAWSALQAANTGHAPSYGDDYWTQLAADKVRETFETDCEVFFVFNGTAANSLALATLCQSYHSVLCSKVAHIETDECGAPQFFSNGTKILLLEADHGKIHPADIEVMVRKRTDLHYPKPHVVSITQATELGTVYSLEELRLIGQATKEQGLYLHMDGARFANAVASLGAKPSDLSWKIGVDVLCFGTTKNGGNGGETVVFFNHDLARDFEYRCKQAGQLASKMRFMTAPIAGMLEGGAWLGHAGHANAMAALLHEKIKILPHCRVLFEREANAVFAELPASAISQLRLKGWKFYTFIGEGGCRLMCSWDTTEDDVNEFANDIAAAQQNV